MYMYGSQMIAPYSSVDLTKDIYIYAELRHLAGLCLRLRQMNPTVEDAFLHTNVHVCRLSG